MTEYGEPHRRLARSGFAHETEHLARVDVERDLVHDVDVFALELDTKTFDFQRARARHPGPRPPRSIPIAALAKPSPTRLVPIVSRPIAVTGSTTPHGWPASSPCRFSLIMRPQSAAGGCRPKPRKLSAAITAMLNVSRSVASTTRGLVMLGRTSPRRIFLRGTPM